MPCNKSHHTPPHTFQAKDDEQEATISHTESSDLGNNHLEEITEITATVDANESEKILPENSPNVFVNELGKELLFMIMLTAKTE